MSRSPCQSPLRQKKDGHSPPPQPSPAVSPPQNFPNQSNSSVNEGTSTEVFGSPLHSLLLRTKDPIPPPPTPPPAHSNHASNSPLRDEEVVVTDFRTLLEGVGSPIPHLESSPEVLAVTNRMSAPAAPTESKVGRGVGKGMRMESWVAEWAGLSKVEFGIRVLELVFTMISFSVMSADKTSGWTGDSFDRYQEFRYCISVNIIAFVYSGFQLYAQVYHMTKMRRILDRPLGYYFDFFFDQVLAYLLISASSSAATRNDEWTSMFGHDEFTNKINGSIAMSFFAFFAFVFSSVISAYRLFSWSP